MPQTHPEAVGGDRRVPCLCRATQHYATFLLAVFRVSSGCPKLRMENCVWPLFLLFIFVRLLMADGLHVAARGRTIRDWARDVRVVFSHEPYMT